jgi:dTDP-4-dehydrorhamnose 3,5-epimerase
MGVFYGAWAVIFKETDLRGAYLIELEELADDRGSFARVCERELEAHGLPTRFPQSNLSRNRMVVEHGLLAAEGV